MYAYLLSQKILPIRSDLIKYLPVSQLIFEFDVHGKFLPSFMVIEDYTVIREIRVMNGLSS